MKILKFGGTSLGSVTRIRDVAKLVDAKEKKVIVLSAMSGTTNDLVKIAEFLYKKNMIAAMSLILSLEENYLKVVEDLFSTESFKVKGEELIKSHINCIKSFTKDVFTLFITQGFISRNTFGEIDNLKRGGSDYTASLVGVALNADEVQIWTDIDGVHNNDPRIIENTKSLTKISFEEAAELAYFGAKILHPASIHPAKLANIPVRLKNTMQPEAYGTLITSEINEKGIKTNFAIIDAGMTELIRPALYQAFHSIENLTSQEDSIEKYDVVGPICESSDCFGKLIPLPKTTRGDILVINSCGAYGEVMASQYNLRRLPLAVY